MAVGGDTSRLHHFLATARRIFRLIATPPKRCIVSTIATVEVNIRRFAIAYKRMHSHTYIYIYIYLAEWRRWQRSVIESLAELQRLFKHPCFAKIIFLRSKNVF